MGDVLALRCVCGYSPGDLDSGGLMTGAVRLFMCANCRDVVSALTLSFERPASYLVAPACPRCGTTRIEPWGEGQPPAGACPRCGMHVQTEVVGIAD